MDPDFIKILVFLTLMPGEYILLQNLLELCKFFEQDSDTQAEILFDLVQHWNIAQDQCIHAITSIIINQNQNDLQKYPEGLIENVVRNLIKRKIWKPNFNHPKHSKITQNVHEILKLCFKNSL